MRTLLRTLIILVVAVLVSGATYGLGRTSAVASLLPSRGRPMQMPAQSGTGTTAGAAQSPAGQTGTAGQPTDGQAFRGEPRGGSGLIGLVGLLRSLALIAVVVALAGLAGRLVGGRRTGAASPELESPM